MKLKLKIAMFTLMLCSVQSMFSQTKTVSGTVADDTGMPMPGVAVVVGGTTNGVQTDFDGNYSISNVSSSDELVFTYVGMKTLAVAVGQQSGTDVLLET